MKVNIENIENIESKEQEEQKKNITSLMQLNQHDFLKELNQQMKPFKEVMMRYRCAIMEIETKFRVLNDTFSVQLNRNPIESIKTRLKTEESLVQKLYSRNLPVTIEAIEKEIHDVAGVRVICSFPEDIYVLAKCLIEQDDIRVIEEKDYISTPKANGYRSLHLIVEVPIFMQNEKKHVKVEVQFRTIAMDFWASLEHKVRYKKDIPVEVEAQLQAELKECADVSAMLDRKMENIKNRLTKINF